MNEQQPVARRRFLQLIGAGAITLFTLNPLSLFAQKNADYVTQLELIDGIKNYCRKKLGMQLGSHFYTNWEMSEGLLYYVYVSKSDEVRVPEGVDQFLYFGTNVRAARQFSDSYEAKGFHTLVYRTAGTSATLLNKTLMSYPMDAIAVIVFHEALHVHLRINRRTIPLSIEEAAADVLAKYISIDYRKIEDKINRRKLNRTLKTMERIYKVVNTNSEKLSKEGKEQELIFNKSYKKIKKILRKSNIYQKNRFSYPVNNAFFIRNNYYSKYYFELKQLYKRLDESPTRFINFVANLPEELEEALSLIRAKNNERA